MASRGGEDAAIADIAADDKPVAPTLYQAYSSNLRKAVDAVFADGRNAGTADRLRANVSRFAAYKAWHATAQVREALDENGGDMEAARRTLRRFNRWQAAEYNTAVARSRTAKQWQQWNDGGDNSRVFPNIVWLPSMSTTPREEHRAFWNRVWPKDDPFWDTNQPGNLWNCKCDWEQTDEPATNGNPTAAIRHNGLEGNPGKTGEVFTDECSYIKKVNAGMPTEIIRAVRDINRSLYADTDLHFSTSIGRVWVDNISIIEVTKGAKTDESYFLKQEIARHFDLYASQLQPLPDEAIDLSHNNPDSDFYKRKEQFEKMKVFRLKIIGQDYKGNRKTFDYQVKLGKYKNSEKLNLYSITEPW